MKKRTMALLFLVFTGAAAFALPLKISAGGGVLTDVGLSSIQANLGPLSTSLLQGTIGAGAFAFVDAEYLEVSAGLLGGYYAFGYKIPPDPLTNLEGSFFALDFSLSVKFPVTFGRGKFIFFPLLGFGYQAVLAAKLEGEAVDTPSDDLSALRFIVGTGADFAIGERLYLRCALLGALRRHSKSENDFIDEMDRSGVNTETISASVALKIALGIKL